MTDLSSDNADNANVVSLPFGSNPDWMGSIAQIDAYWHGLQPAGDIPARSAVDPRGLDGALEYAFVLERIAPGIGRFRLAGSHLSDMMGMDVRGMPATALFVPEARAKISDAIEKACSTPARIVLEVESARGIGRARLTGQMILLPLKNELGIVSKVLGCFQAKGQIGRQPRRFHITHVTSRTLTCKAPAPAPAQAPALPAAPQMAGFAESPMPMAPRTKKGPDAPKRPALRLVADNS